MTMLWSTIERFADTKPNDTALIGEDAVYNWSELRATVVNIAQQLQLSRNQVIALYADNSPSWVIIDLASRLAGVTLLPLPAFFSDQQLKHAINQTSATAIIYQSDDRINQLLQLTNNDSEQIDGLGLYLTKLKPAKTVPLPNRTGKITFTSGSTGQPKGVCLSSEQQTVVAESLIKATKLNAAKHLCVLPFSTLLENVGGIYAPLLSGGTVIAVSQSTLGFNGSRGFELAKLLVTISRYQPDSMILLPELLMALVSAVNEGWQPPSSLEFIAVGGSRVSPSLLQQAQQCGLPVFEGYGLSECCSVVSLNRPGDSQKSSVGKVLDHVTVTIEEGEIIVIGNAFLGYIDEPESWNSTKVNTGDLGYFDQQGYLHINGRKKNLLISSFGRNINPEWVESELLSNGLLKQCIVFGDARPYCIALVNSRLANTSDDDIQYWINEVNGQLPDYARIVRWYKLPQALSFQQGLMTSNGRTVRSAIFKHFEKNIEQLYLGNM